MINLCSIFFIFLEFLIDNLTQIRHKNTYNDSEISERFSDIKLALNNLDLIVFLPIKSEYSIEHTEENPAYRKLTDKFFKKIYRDSICDIFPRYNHPKIIELSGDRIARLKKLENYLI
jgi:hypothetical protein